MLLKQSPKDEHGFLGAAHIHPRSCFSCREVEHRLFHTAGKALSHTYSKIININTGLKTNTIFNLGIEGKVPFDLMLFMDPLQV